MSIKNHARSNAPYPSPSPSPSLRKSKDLLSRQGPSDFETFWAAYPKKVAKRAAIKAFEKLKADDALLETIIQALGKAKQSADWTKEHGRYIPNPATWLNGARWEDEPPEEKSVTVEQGEDPWPVR